MEGIIFDIQRFSLHDGPGIRTTVFLKGCALRCFWCHNPEGLRREPQIRFSPARCMVCGACAEVCPAGAHELGVDGHALRREVCRACGACAEVCCAGALELCGRRRTVDDVVAEVLLDRVFYKHSRGGVTLSGGEPLLQRPFAQELLAQCKAEGIHTAIETAALCPWDELAELLPVVDLVLMDVKHVDPARHRQATGVSCEAALGNARRLAQSGKPAIVRTPVVPGVNDKPEDIGAIAGFVAELNDLRRAADGDSYSPIALELLPFHALAAEKYRSLDLAYEAGGLVPPGREEMTELTRAAAARGVEVRCR